MVALDEMDTITSRPEPGIDELLSDPRQHQMLSIDTGRARVLKSLRLAGLVGTVEQAAHLAVNMWPPQPSH